MARSPSRTNSSGRPLNACSLVRRSRLERDGRSAAEHGPPSAVNAQASRSAQDAFAVLRQYLKFIRIHAVQRIGHFIKLWRRSPGSPALRAARAAVFLRSTKNRTILGLAPIPEWVIENAPKGDGVAGTNTYSRLLKRTRWPGSPVAQAGIHQTLLDEGPKIGPLLTAFQENSDRTGKSAELMPYGSGLVAAFRSRYNLGIELSPRSGIADPLSAHEGAILNLIAQGLSNKEIARDLAIAPETVKSHVKHIFIKLGAEKRAEAVGSCAEPRACDYALIDGSLGPQRGGVIRHSSCRSRAENIGRGHFRLKITRSHSAGLGRLRFLHQP
jgi:DNA-binding CsgD family transcriptional regulator